MRDDRPPAMTIPYTMPPRRYLSRGWECADVWLFVSYSRLEAKRLRKKGRARDKGNRQGLAKYFSQKSFFGQGAESVAEMEIGKHRRTWQRLLRADTPAFSEKRRLPFVESRLVPIDGNPLWRGVSSASFQQRPEPWDPSEPFRGRASNPFGTLCTAYAFSYGNRSRNDRCPWRGTL